MAQYRSRFPSNQSKYLDDPSAFTYEENIRRAASELDTRYDVVVYEGTGHPGVGSVVDLSNAKVAKMVDAQVVMLLEGGIGNTIDRLALCLPIFQAEKVPIIGVIINKVLPEKMEKVGYYLKKKLDQMGVPLLGLVPYDKTMADPIMSTIRRAINGRFTLNEHMSRRRVEAIIPGSLIDEMDDLASKTNLLLVVSYKLADEALKKIERLAASREDNGSPLAGVILTGEERLEQPATDYELHLSYLNAHEIPVISTSLDTLGAFTKINNIEVKINVSTPWKVERANQLIREHVDLDYILNRIR